MLPVDNRWKKDCVRYDSLLQLLASLPLKQRLIRHNWIIIAGQPVKLYYNFLAISLSSQSRNSFFLFQSRPRRLPGGAEGGHQEGLQCEGRGRDDPNTLGRIRGEPGGSETSGGARVS